MQENNATSPIRAKTTAYATRPVYFQGRHYQVPVNIQAKHYVARRKAGADHAAALRQAKRMSPAQIMSYYHGFNRKSA